MQLTHATGAEAKLLEQLRNPLKMRIFALGGAWLLGFFTIVRPYEAKIAATNKLLGREQARATTIRQIEQLKQQVAICDGHVMKCDQFNEWVQGVIDKTRVGGILVRNMEMKDIRKLGPYHVISLKLELEATYRPLLELVEWLEDQGRANRLDSLRVKEENGRLTVDMELRGLVEKNDSQK